MSEFSPFTFLHINDHHLGTPRSYRYRPSMTRRWEAIKRQMVRTNADLLLVGGDIARDGDTHEEEYALAREDLDTLPFPSHVIPGNMDVGNRHTDREGPRTGRSDIALNMTSERLQLFASHFGPVNWTFMHRDVRFTGFFAAVAGSGLREEERFWRFMERLPELPSGRHHVAMMHYWLYIESIDEPNYDIALPDEYLLWYFGIDEPHRSRIFELLKAAGVDVLFCGHVHTGRPVEVVDGIRICKAPAAGNTAQLTDRWDEIETTQGFSLCSVTDGGIDVTYVLGDDQSADESDTYGPGGHPTLQARDYSIAPEQPPLAPDPWLLES
ncbi:MAG TPA: metallophosphoesterase [Armatimonadota bacterium]|nr:metallophosphoesterase [Armatimonadota bacterium]